MDKFTHTEFAMRQAVALAVTWLLIVSVECLAAVQVQVEVNALADASPDYKFKKIPAPSNTDAGNIAKAEVAAGTVDANGLDARALVDGQAAVAEDQPRRNFFFRRSNGRNGGRVLFDLGRPIEIQQINTYSWHPGVRAPQVYTLWAKSAKPKRRERRGAIDLAEAGWTRLAAVDTRQVKREPGGQVGVSIADDSGQLLGKFRYVLFDIEAADPDHAFGNTFYSEIDIVDGQEHHRPDPSEHIDSITTDGGHEIVFDTTGAPDLRGWVNARLKPVCKEWYPKIVAMLPSEDFQAPQKFTIYFSNSTDGVAYTAGRDVYCAGAWFERNLQGEAAGAVVHELVHVVQQYGRQRNPSWLVEGLCDYIRWFLYEPASLRPQPNFARANYNDSYRTSGAFLNYVIDTHGEEILPKLNAAMRQGKYSHDWWRQQTGQTAQQLWKAYEQSEQQTNGK